MKQVFVVLFLVFVLSFFLPFPALSYYDKDIPGMDMYGDISPNGISSNGILNVSFPNFSTEELQNYKRINITIEYNQYNYQKNAYEQIADPTSLRNIYISFNKKDSFEGVPLQKDSDYKLAKRDCVTGDVHCLNYDIEILKSDKIDSEGHLEFYFENLKLLQKGNVKVTIRLFKNPNDSTPAKVGYMDLPVYERDHNPSQSATPTPSVYAPSPTSIPATGQPLSTSTPSPTPTEKVNVEQKLEDLKSKIDSLEKQQKKSNEEIARQKNVLQKILDMITTVLKKFGLSS